MFPYLLCLLYSRSFGSCPVGLDYNSSEGQDPTSNECPGYDTKQSDGEAQVMLEL